LALAPWPKAVALACVALAFWPTAVALIPLASAPVPHWNEPDTGSEQNAVSGGIEKLDVARWPAASVVTKLTVLASCRFKLSVELRPASV